MEFFTLNNGIKMPALGSGTNSFGKENGELTGDFSPAVSAIEVGYRFFDTAISYRNEAGIGKTVKESGLPREDFFLVTKIPGREGFTDTKENVKKNVLESLDRLCTDYIDLYLLHQPWDDEAGMLAAWSVLEDFVSEGRLRAIGVSNFNPSQLDVLLSSSTAPAVNQVQCNPTNWNDESIAYSLSHGVRPMAWGPLRRCDDEHRALFEEVGKKYGKTWSQTLLRYDIQRGIVVIPKSHNKAHQAENLNVFDFVLSEEDMSLLNKR